MYPQYQVSVIATDGSQAWVGAPGPELSNVHYRRKLNEAGTCNLTFPDPYGVMADLFDEDCLIEIRRKGPSGWRVEATYLFTYGRHQIHNDSLHQYVAHGVGLLDLLDRRVVVAADDPAVTDEGYSEKAGVASTVAYGYVDEQAGPLASLARQTPGLTSSPDLFIGGQVDLKGGWESGQLLTLLGQAVAKGLVDVRVVRGTGYTFLFEVYQAGADKTVARYPTAPHVLLTTRRGNIRDPRLTRDRDEARSVAYVLGQGEGVEREVREVVSPAAAVSPVGRSEMTAYGSDIERGETEALITRGWEKLTERRAQETFEFAIIPGAPGTLYPDEIDLGDRVTVEMEGEEQNHRIVTVEGFLSQEGETMNFETEVEA